MNKKIKKVITCTMLTTLLLGNSVKAEDLGKVKFVTTSYQSDDDFWNSIIGSNTPTPTSTPINEDNLNQADRSVISYFSDAKNVIKEYVASDDFTNLKSKAKNLVITGIDFLFYDGTIKGYTRKELTEKGKEYVMQTIADTLELLEKYYPGLSDTILEKYGKAKDFLKEKFSNIKSYLKDWMGEEYYNMFGEEFNQLLDEFGDIGSMFGSFLDDKYQSWKLK